MNWLRYIAPLLLLTCCTAVDVCNRPPPAVDFGRAVEAEGVVGRSRAKFECSPGYVLEGSEWVTCTKEEWEPLPKCLAPCIITKEQLDANGLLLSPCSRHSRVIQHNSTVKVTCREGNGFGSPWVRTCVDGHIDLPPCTSVCGRSPPAVDFGQPTAAKGVVGRVSVKFQCNPGYVMEGSEWVTCTREEWEPLPKCLAPCVITKEQLEAKHLLLFPGGSHSQVFQHNSTLEFLCREGYELAKRLEWICVDGHIDLPICYPETNYKAFDDLSTSIFEHLKEEEM